MVIAQATIGISGERNERVVYLIARHNGRPLILRFDTRGELAARSALDQILATFRFLDGD